MNYVVVVVVVSVVTIFSGRAHGMLTGIYVDHPSDSPSFLSCFDRIVAFFFKLTCTVPFFFLGCVMSISPAIRLLGPDSLRCMIWPSQVAFRETSRKISFYTAFQEQNKNLTSPLNRVAIG
jgi:hypothetical protein